MRRPTRLAAVPLEDRSAPAGDLDPTFGTGGNLILPAGDIDGIAAMAVQPDGRILLVGSSVANRADVAVIRLTADGAMDPTFGDRGRVTVDLGGGDTAGAVAVQPDGMIVVAGTAASGGGIDFAAARLTAAGVPDPAFGVGGRSAVAFPNRALATYVYSVRVVLVQPDGGIVLAGTESSGNTRTARTDFAVARLTAAGAPDPGFGDGGRATFTFGTFGSPRAGGLLPDGRIVLAGGGGVSGPGSQFAVIRLTPGGAFDSAFGDGGKVAVNFGFTNSAAGVSVRPDGRILVAGTARAPSQPYDDFAIARLTPDGAPDPSFGDGGKAWFDAGASESSGAVALHSDGGILLGGHSTAIAVGPDGPRSDFAAARLTADGKPDTGFGAEGVTLVDIGAKDEGQFLVAQPDGRVLLGGKTDQGFAIIRLTADPPAAAVRGAVLAGGAGPYAALLNPAAGGYAPAGIVAVDSGSAGPVRVASADVTGDGVPDHIGGTGPGTATRVTVLDGKTTAAVASVRPFEGGFTGGVFVAAADLTGDGKAEVIVTPDRGGGPAVVVYDGAGLAAGNPAEVARFFGIDDGAFRGGARPAAGDVTGDGVADVVIAAGFLGGPRVTIWDGKSVRGGPPIPLANFFAFEDTLRNGAFVAAGDLTGDGVADLAFGGGPGGGPRVRLFDGKQLLAAGPFARLDDIATAQRANFFAGDDARRGGVRLALRDADGDGKAELVAGSGDGEPSRVRVYLAGTLLANLAPNPSQEFDPFGAVLADGVFVG
jgi:uncharacterized delta-60 repeat protein